MSHREDCPDRWTAEREGERAHDWGRGRYANPYDDPWHSGRGCEEAARYWDDGFRSAERREEWRLEEEAAARRSAARRAAEQEEEDYIYSQRHWEPQPYPEPTDRDLCAANAHQEYLEGVDRFGRRCYCGLVRYLDNVELLPALDGPR